MTLSGRPLLDNVVDDRLFTGRVEETYRLQRAINSGWNVLITGTAGSGKSSLLHHVAYQARTRERRTDDDSTPTTDTAPEFVYVHAESAANGGELLARIATQLLPGTATAPDAQAAGPPRILDMLREGYPRRNENGNRAVVMVDDVSGRAGHDVFGKLRDQLWELALTWIVTTRDPGALTTPPADAFFDTRIELPGLSDQEAVEMLGRRLDGLHTGAWSRQVADAVEGNPRRILDLARDVLERDGGDLGRVEVLIDPLARRNQALNALPRAAHMLVAELERRGGASASDPELLAALGWTRPRAVQLLGDLERRGLLVSAEVRGERGRPRKVYRVVEPYEYDERVAATGTGAASATSGGSSNRPEKRP